MTTLNIKLTSTLQATLSHAGVYAAAVYFDSANPGGVWKPLVNNGTVLSGGTVAIGLPQELGQKIYFLIQSAGTDTAVIGPQSITSQAMVNWTTAGLMDFRYDSFEVSLTSPNGAGPDAGNLTSVNGFGLPMSVVVPYTNNGTVVSSASVGYGISGGQVFGDIDAINPSITTYTSPYTVGPLAGQTRMAVGPSDSVAAGFVNPPFQDSDWTGYIQSLQGTAASAVVLNGVFNGAEDAGGDYHNSGYFAYQLQWDAAGSAFWLAPLAQSSIKGYIRITPDQLAQSIYAQLGTVDIYTSQTDATAYLSGMNVGANNQWGKILSTFLTGFTGGFYGQAGISPNAAVTTPVNLNNNANWDPTYAFLQNVVSNVPAYQAYDPYSKVFYQHSNSYGSGYSDALMSQYAVGGPLISVFDPGTTSDVANINLTIFDDSEQPTGYTPPVIYNYIAPPPGGYALPSTNGTGNNIVINMAALMALNAGVVFDPAGQITLSVMSGMSGGQPQWTPLTIDGSAAVAGPLGLWQQWSVSGGPGSYSIAPASPVQAMPTGSIQILHFPTAADGVAWYKLDVGDKTYNLYVTSSSSQFVDSASGTPSTIAIDGLATIAGGGSSTFSINLVSNNTVTYDPQFLQPNYGNVTPPSTAGSPWTAGAPFAPVAGTLAGSAFTSLSGQASPGGNVISTQASSIAFAWAGLNSTNGASWASAYSNQIDGLTIAHVTLHPVAGGTDITVDGTADIDGKWVTSPVLLPNATYTVTMQEYLPADSAYANPLTPISQSLTLTVNAPCFRAGTLIATPAGPRPVESLRAGERVRLALEDASAEIIWTGHRQVDCTRHPDPRKVWPIRIAAGALGDATPQRDLYLSPDHALYLDGVLIPARRLVNGTTITQVQVRSVTYHHIELAAHDVLLAEGAAAESYLDTGDRTNFTDAPGATKLHPDFSIEVWEAEGRAPLVVAGPVLDAVRARLASAKPEGASGTKGRYLVG